MYIEAFLDDRMTHVVISHALSILNHHLGSLIDKVMTLSLMAITCVGNAGRRHEVVVAHGTRLGIQNRLSHRGPLFPTIDHYKL